MRLYRHSSLHGLGSMRTVTPLIVSSRYQEKRRELKLVRPLLNVSKDEVNQVLFEANVRSIHDPSNQNIIFDRVRARKAITDNIIPAQNIFASNKNNANDNLEKRIGMLAADIQIATSSLEKDADALFHQHCTILEPYSSVTVQKIHCLLNQNSSNMNFNTRSDSIVYSGERIPIEIVYRVLEKALLNVRSAAGYPPRRDAVERLYLWMREMFQQEMFQQEMTKESGEMEDRKDARWWSTSSSYNSAVTWQSSPFVLKNALRTLHKNLNYNSSCCNDEWIEKDDQGPFMLISSLPGKVKRRNSLSSSSSSSVKSLPSSFVPLVLNVPCYWSKDGAGDGNEKHGLQVTVSSGKSVSDEQEEEEEYFVGETVLRSHSKDDVSEARMMTILTRSVPSVYVRQKVKNTVVMRPVLTPYTSLTKNNNRNEKMKKKSEQYRMTKKLEYAALRRF